MNKKKSATIDLTENKLFHLHTGIVDLAVCAPEEWKEDKVENEANLLAGNPGTANGRWVISEQEGNPIVCAEDSHRRHWLLVC